MAEGNSTYDGLAVPLSGESEITQVNVDTDILTLTGGTTQTGDFLVCQDVDGTENLVISSSGLVTSAVGASFTTGTFSGVISAVLPDSSTAAAVEVTLTSTGAVAAGATLDNAFLVTSGSKSTINAAYAYRNLATDGDCVGTTNYLLACHGSKSPNYFLGIGATACGVAGATDNGFVNAGVFLTSALATTVAMVGLKVQFGDSVFYVMCVTETAMS